MLCAWTIGVTASRNLQKAAREFLMGQRLIIDHRNHVRASTLEIFVKILGNQDNLIVKHTEMSCVFPRRFCAMSQNKPEAWTELVREATPQVLIKRYGMRMIFLGEQSLKSLREAVLR